MTTEQQAEPATRWLRGFRRAATLLRRFPTTLLMLAVLVAVAALTNTYAARMPRVMLESVGFPAPGLAMGEAYRLVTSALVTNGPRILPAALVMVLLSLGAAEFKVGSWVTLATFWGIHAVTLLAMYFGGGLLDTIAPALGADSLRGIPDVGPSAGYMGCLALALRAWGGRWPPRVAGVIVLWLLADLAGLVSIGPALRAESSADVAHLLAFSLGWAVGSAMLSRRRTALGEPTGA